MTDAVPSTLGNYVHVKHGFAFKGEYFTEDATPNVLVTPGNFAIGGGFQDDKLKYYAGPVPDDYILQTGDLVVTMTDLSKAGDTLGYPALIPASPGRRYLHNQRIGLVTINEGTEASKRFLFYRLRASDYRHHILATASGSTVRHTSPGRIREFGITLPPIDKQCAIAGVLGALDDKIEQNRRTARVLERLARAIFCAWFVDFEPVKAKAAGAGSFPSMSQRVFDVLPTSFIDSDIGPVPKGWGVLRLDDILTLQRGFDLPKQSRTEGTHPILSASGINGLHYEWKVKGPGVTTGRSGVLGQVFYVDGDFWPLNTSLWVKEYRRSNPWHAYFLLQTLNLARFNAGSAVPTLNRNHVHSLPIVAAPDCLLNEFAGMCGPMFSMRKQLSSESEKLAEIRDYLLPRMLSGSVRVEVASG
jgi:type I restriction enzyme S subunit